jgi:CxxC motif-containing protein
MEESVKMICITCPKGCSLDVTREGQTIVKIKGNGCKRGETYAKAELSDPRRMVASTVKIGGAIHPQLPVATSAPFPKPRIKELLFELRKVELQAPVKMGDVLLKDVLGTGVDVIASRDMEGVGL